MPVRLLLVDDHPVFREGLAALLRTRKDFEVVGEASDGAEALACTRALRPDLVLMDIHMPRAGGLEATRQIRARFPQVRVLILTVSEDEQDLFEAVKAGAQGYLVKNMASRDVLDLIARATTGEAVFTPSLASRALLALSQREAGGEALSEREREVLKELVAGKSNAAIARTLGLSESTVRFHLRNILSKLHARSRTEAAVRAVSRRIVPLPPAEEGN